MPNDTNKLRANWLYFLGTKKNKTETFVYGLSLPTEAKKERTFRGDKKGFIAKGKDLYLFKSIKNVIDFNNDNKLYFPKFYSHPDFSIRAEIEFFDFKKFVQPYYSCFVKEEVQSPINSLVNITSYYTKEIFDAKLDDDTKINLLKKLQDDTNQAFYGNYLRIGCFEIGETFQWAEHNLPFGIKYDANKDQYYIYKDENYKENISVVLKGYSSYFEKTYEKLLYLDKGEQQKYFDCKRLDNWNYRYSVYSEDGCLLHEDLVILCKKISIGISSIGGQTIIDDEYSTRDSSLIVSSESSNITSVGVKVPDANEEITFIKDNLDALKELIKFDQVSEEEGRWFNKSQDLLSDIVKYINLLCIKAEQIIFIDPYADSDLICLSRRLNVQNIKIISCKTSNQDINTIKKRIEKQKLTYPPKYHFIKKEFHDRFIAFDVADEREVYCMPNSINAILKNDDFLMLRLNGKVKLQAIKHIRYLESKCNDSNLLKNIKSEDDEK